MVSEVLTCSKLMYGLQTEMANPGTAAKCPTKWWVIINMEQFMSINLGDIGRYAFGRYLENPT